MATNSGNSSEGSQGSSAGSGASSEASANSSAASEGTSGGSTNATEASEGSSGSSNRDATEPVPPDEDATDASDVIIATSALGTVTASTVGSVLLTIFAVNELSAELYLRNNALAVRHHIQRGAGEALEDLAHLCGVPTHAYPRFAEVTRQARHDLVAHLEEPRSVDAEHTRAFLSDLARALGEDHDLARAIIAQAYGD
ncbi:hypothetical protein DL240_18295 [Lujinxingia litoralis]|uniref:DUF3015 domain-containing protein n=2 Tax=Lujinxingia litoralis TaxID=2211119 RepID=A0A328C1K4_9DELT|nr:hypothetical protein DL240_18295 [Lujinxingia litoralis]